MAGGGLRRSKTRSATRRQRDKETRGRKHTRTSRPSPLSPCLLVPVSPRTRRRPLRDIEFLPAWYPQLRRRKRAIWIQSIATAAIVLVLAGVTVAKRWNV